MEVETEMKREYRWPVRWLSMLPVFFLAFFPRVSVLAEEKGEEGKKAPPPWKGNLSIGLSLARGNTAASSFSFTFAADGPVQEKILWLNKGVFLFGQTDGETSAESLQALTRVDWKHTDGFFSFCEFQASRDRFKNQSYRLLPALGVGYRVLATEDVTLGFDGGYSQVIIRYHDSGVIDSYASLKVGNLLSWKISEGAEFTNALEINSDVANLANYFIRLEANLITALAKNWSVKLTFIDRFDNEPVGVGIQKNDITFITGISKKF